MAGRHQWDRLASCVSWRSQAVPLIFRSMLTDAGKPLIGSDNNQLGVRTKPHPRPDIPVTGDSQAQGECR